MKPEPQQNLTWLIKRYASDPATADQVKRLPLFAIPTDTEHKFKRLLDKFDEKIE
jgi:hypothetical protein